MFRKNEQHKQPAMFSSIYELPKKQLKRLKESWAATFYNEFFTRIEEDLFSVLYSDEPSRPNIPINVLMVLETMKSGFGWSDQELYDAFCYNMQVRYALGSRDLKEGHFELRTLYNFRSRITRYMQETGINLIEKAFEQVTDEQTKAFQLKTGKLRMDSTQIASNIREMSRLQLLVEELRDDYGKEPAYQMLARVFQEHFTLDDEDDPRPRKGKELSAGSLQSPDDWEATYRRKNNDEHQGYVANLTETCDPENKFQLINKVQVEPNTTEDADMLKQALPDMKERTDVERIDTDGGYGSPDVDEAMRKAKVVQIQTAIRGRKPSEEKLGIEDFDWEIDEDGKPQEVICPHGQSVEVQPGRKQHRYLAYFDSAVCRDCPFVDQCPTEPHKSKPKHVLRFSQQETDLALRRKRSADVRATGQNLRAGAKSMVRSVKHPLGNGKLPVRGKSRVSMMVTFSAAMTNIRRIHGYREKLREEKRKAREAQKQMQEAMKNVFVSFLGFLHRCLLQHSYPKMAAVRVQI